jgi:hypothetical protein
MWAIGDQADVPACIHPSIATETRGLLGRVIAVELDDNRYYSHIACNCTRNNLWLTKTKMKWRQVL